MIVDPGVSWSGDALGLLEQIGEVREAIGWSLEPAGSNNWAVSGERSATGMPLLAGDPHITTSMPDCWYTLEGSTPDLELRGGSMPGFPGIVIGHTRHVAWSFTNVMGDVQDLFVERIRDGEGGPEYEFEGEWRPVTMHQEEIAIRGRSPEQLQVRQTHHGPIVNDALGARAGEPLALAWTAIREPVVEQHRRATRAASRAARSWWRPSAATRSRRSNMVWADDSGNIGYKLIGKLPIRRGNCPDLPKPGWTGEYEWEGYVPYDDLPELVEPAGRRDRDRQQPHRRATTTRTTSPASTSTATGPRGSSSCSASASGSRWRTSSASSSTSTRSRASRRPTAWPGCTRAASASCERSSA